MFFRDFGQTACFALVTAEVCNWAVLMFHRFIDMVKKIESVVRSGELPDYFDKDVNILHWQYQNKPQALEDLANYLGGIIRSGDYMRLLRCVP